MAAASLLAVRGAAATDHYLSIGALGGFSAHVGSPVLGTLGGEVTYNYHRDPGQSAHVPDWLYPFSIGGFAQAQSVGFDHFRFAVGPQVTAFMLGGAEIGAFIEEGSLDAASTTQRNPDVMLSQGKPGAVLPPRATTFGLQFAPFISLGFASLSLRMGIPLASLSPGQPYAFDIGMMGTLKIPMGLDGPTIPNMCGIDPPTKGRRAVALALTR